MKVGGILNIKYFEKQIFRVPTASATTASVNMVTYTVKEGDHILHVKHFLAIFQIQLFSSHMTNMENIDLCDQDMVMVEDMVS